MLSSISGPSARLYEPGLDDLVESNVKAGRLSFTTDLAEGMKGAQAIFIAVSTPSRRGDGHADLSYVFAAAEEIARTLATARETGRLVLDLPLEAIAADHLTRDRLPVEDEEMVALKSSLAAHGQRTPIEVTPLTGEGPGALPYGLISGWRRLAAPGPCGASCTGAISGCASGRRHPRSPRPRRRRCGPGR